MDRRSAGHDAHSVMQTCCSTAVFFSFFLQWLCWHVCPAERCCCSVRQHCPFQNTEWQYLLGWKENSPHSEFLLDQFHPVKMSHCSQQIWSISRSCVGSDVLLCPITTAEPAPHLWSVANTVKHVCWNITSTDVLVIEQKKNTVKKSIKRDILRERPLLLTHICSSPKTIEIEIIDGLEWKPETKKMCCINHADLHLEVTWPVCHNLFAFL